MVKHSNHSLDETDIAILKGLFRFRYLTVDLISEINPDLSYSAWTKRLRKLLTSGYIDRPPKQLWTFRKHEKAIYALDQKGADYLAQHFDIHFSKTVKWHEKNRRYRGQDPFSHALSTARFMIELEQALVKEGTTLTHQDELFGVDYVTGVSWETYIATEFTTIKPKLKPDGIFSIKKKGSAHPLNFCLEIDRGTMPIRSTHFDRSSILKKYMCYRDTHMRKALQTKFRFKNFRVLMVTTTEKRAQNMRDLWAEEFSDMSKLCLFTSFEAIDEKGILDAWCETYGEHAYF